MPFDPDLNIVLVCGQSNDVGEEDTVAPTAPTYPNAASMKMIGADGVLKAYSDPYADNTGALFATPYLNNTGIGVSFAGQLLNDLVEHFGGTWCATCLAQGGASIKYYPAPRLDSNPVNCGFWFDTDLSDNVQMSPLLYATIQRIRHARTLGVIRYIVWGQGATDGILGTDPEEFKTISTQIMDIRRRQSGSDVPIIRLGIADKPAFVAADEGPGGTYEGNTWDEIQTAIQEYSVPNTTIVNPDGIAIQADQLHYTTSGYMSLGARIAAAITGETVSSLPLIASGMLFHLDATDALSYPGTGQTFANLIENPADGSSKTAWDFYLGDTGSATSTDPSFLTHGGGAGTAGDNWSFFQVDGGDRFNIKANTDFIKKIHKTSETDLEFSVYMAFYWPTGITTGIRYLFGNNRTSSGSLQGFYLAYDPVDQRFELRHYNAVGSSDTNIGSGIVLSGQTWMAPGQYHFLNFSLRKTSGTAFDYKLSLNSDAAITGSGTWSAATNDPGVPFGICGIDGSGTWPSGARLLAFSMTNKFATDTEIAAIREHWYGWPFSVANCKLTLPINSTGALSGSAYEVPPADLDDYNSDYCRRWKHQVRFYCPDAGAVTSGTTGCRSELRELTDYTFEDGMTPLSISRTMKPTETNPTENLTLMQIHENSADGPWVKVRIKQQSGVYVIKADVAQIIGGGDVAHVLNTPYTLGDPITITLAVDWPYATVTVDDVSESYDMSGRTGPIFFKPGGVYPADHDGSGDHFVNVLTGGTDLPG